MKSITRRTALQSLAIALTPGSLLSRQQPKAIDSNQGMSSRHIRPAPRGKPSGLPFHARFTDVGQAAGLKETVICGEPNHADYVLDAMGCGVAFVDYDNDGWLDVLVLCGSRSTNPPADASNRLYKNNRNGTFTDVTRKAGLFRPGYFYGVTVGDFNNDGFEDLFLTGYPQNVLYRNNGDGTFADITKEAGLLSNEPRFGSGCTFIDYDRDGKLDLFVSNYLAFDPKSVPRAGTSSNCNSQGVFCGPRGLPYGRHSLFRNNGDGTFSDVTIKAGIQKVNAGYGLTAITADFDGDGWPDIYLACDSTPSLLFLNQHDGTFKEEALDRGVALSDDGMEQAGMGVSIGDLKCTGRLDIVKTHFAADTPAVYINEGEGEFRDDTLRSGLAAETRFISWGIGIEDLDNDGRQDIFWVTGGIYPELRNDPAQPFLTPRILFRNLGDGRFEELSTDLGPALQALHCSRGCAFGDFDNDGDMDILIVNLFEPPSLLRNDVSVKHHWLKVKLQGVKSNRSAIGASVTVRAGGATQIREVISQTSYLSVNDSRLHFGLGEASKADLEIRWPMGQVERLNNVPIDRLLHVTEGSGITAVQEFG
ncbi:MAG: CRTAC1 family protein [Bryobacteraceae bacterium]